MKKLIWSILLSFSVLMSGCQKSDSVVPMEEAGLIPIPKTINPTGKRFELKSSATIQFLGAGSKLASIANYLSQRISPATGFGLPVSGATGNIILEQIPGEASEAYQLTIEEDTVRIRSTSEAGVFYGVQTLIQLFPVEIESATAIDREWLLPTGIIEDEPEYAYRGSMLDVVRHFISIEDVKHYIDQMAKFKLNHLHLHLTDDQGWRIEIKSWPKLTEIGGSTQVGGGAGGFYTQEQYKEIVAYAAERFITIVPEVDMPGHTNSALASYGELNPGVNLPDGDMATLVEGKIDFDILDKEPVAAELYTGIEVGFSTLATNKELTYKFVEDVIREIAAITPGPYFHIGGDESHVTEKPDYIYFVERVQDLTLKYGKINMGWDEIATATLRPGTIAQFWANEENALLAKMQGNRLLMSPATRTYLDMQYDSTTRLGLHWAAFIELEDSYNWDPATLVDGINKTDIIGVEAPLWTETITNRADIEYMVFPRLAAIAEVAWSPTERRSWEKFKERVAIQGKRWDINNIGFYRSPQVNW